MIILIQILFLNYIDGSNISFDCYLDLIQSKGGLLAIDDYLYNHDDIINSPFEGINHFLNKHKNEIKILHKEYRVFLIKV